LLLERVPGRQTDAQCNNVGYVPGNRVSAEAANTAQRLLPIRASRWTKLSVPHAAERAPGNRAVTPEHFIGSPNRIKGGAKVKQQVFDHVDRQQLWS